MAEQPEFFIDRSLGRRTVAEALLECGLVVHTMASVYGERIGQGLKDETWLRDVGERGWVVLMKDDAIRRRPLERDALIAGGVRVLPRQRAITRRRDGPTIHREPAPHPSSCDAAGPYIFGVYESRIARLWPR